jgi:hypothetical protein
VTGEDSDEVKGYVKQNAVQYPMGIGATVGYDVSAIPHAFLIDKDGKVLWRGHPGTLEATAIDKALAGARPAIVVAGLEDVQPMRRAKDYGAAYVRSKNLLDGGALSERAQAQARNWMKDWETAVAEALASADKAEAAKDLFALWTALQPAADYYQGVPGADVAKQRFTALLADANSKKEVEAGRKFAAARLKEAAYDYDGAYAIFREVAGAFGATKVGKEAALLVKAYEKDGKLGYDQTCGYCKAGGVACPQHRKKKK